MTDLHVIVTHTHTHKGWWKRIRKWHKQWERESEWKSSNQELSPSFHWWNQMIFNIHTRIVFANWRETQTKIQSESEMKNTGMGILWIQMSPKELKFEREYKRVNLFTVHNNKKKRKIKREFDFICAAVRQLFKKKN